MQEQLTTIPDLGLSERLWRKVRFKGSPAVWRGLNLWVMTSGSRRNEALALLAASRLRARLSELTALFTYTIVQSSTLNSEALLLAPLVDGVVLIIEADVTLREAAQQGLEALKATGARVVGAVLNNRRFPIPSAIYQRL